MWQQLSAHVSRLFCRFLHMHGLVNFTKKYITLMKEVHSLSCCILDGLLEIIDEAAKSISS